MKLYFAQGACSKAPHIILRELGLPFELVRVDLRAKTTANGDDFLQINPKGYVPALALDSGDVLTEASAILQYLADQMPEAKLAPAAGTIERLRLQEWLSFIGTELHKSYTMFFLPGLTPETRAAATPRLPQRLGYVASVLEKQAYLLGDNFTVADAYLYNVLTWNAMINYDLSPWPVLVKYMEKIAARPSVQAATEAEK